MNQTQWNIGLSRGAVVAAMLSLAGLAIACPPESEGERAIEGGPQHIEQRVGVPLLRDIPLMGQIFGAVAEQPQGGATSRSTVQMNINGESYRVEVENNQIVRVEHNGDKLGEDRYRKVDDGIEILDKDGNVLQKLNVQMGGNGGGGGGAMPGVRVMKRIEGNGFDKPLAGGKPRVAEVRNLILKPASDRKVMIGVTMSANGDGEGVTVGSVIQGLAAEKAGLRRGDVIVKVSGKDVETSDDVISVLNEKAPGDEVSVIVERDGDEKTMKIVLEKFEAGKLGELAPAHAAPNGEMFQKWFGNGQDGGMVEIEKMFGGANEELKGAMTAIENARDEVEKALEEISKTSVNEFAEAKKELQGTMKEAGESVREALEQVRAAMEQGRVQMHNGGNGLRFVFPAPPEAPNAPAAPEGIAPSRDRVRELIELREKAMNDTRRESTKARSDAESDRMKELEARLKALEEQLARKPK